MNLFFIGHENPYPDFKKKNASVDEIFALMNLTYSGSRILGRFKATGTSAKVTIQGYPQEILSKLVKVKTDKQPIGACFANDGKKGEIYFDAGEAMLITTTLLLHELWHALDERLWKNPTTDNRVQSEIEAHHIQSEFFKELLELIPEAKYWMEEVYPEAEMILKHFSEDDIRSRYSYLAA